MDTENTETAVKKSNKKSKAKDDTSEPMQEDKPSEVVDGYTPESVKKKKKKEKRIDEEEINGGTNGVNGFDLGEDGTAKKKKKKKGVDQDDGAGVQTAVEVKKKKKSKRGDE